MSRLCRALLIAFLVRPAAARAQTDIAALQKRVDALEAEVAELKALIDTEHRERATAPPPDTGTTAATTSDPLHGVQIGLGLDTYYGFNFNRPIGRVNLLRAYDVTSNNFSLNQADVVLERAPDVANGRWFGARIDFQYGQATETLQGSLANEPRPWVYRNVFQAYGTVVAPIGSGLTIDFGKWASALGIEGNYTKDQINYSRSYFFNLLPFYHMGARVSYKVSDGVSLGYWITNGTQQTEAFNNFKDQFVGVVLQPASTVTWNVQYYLGQEHPDVQSAPATSTPATGAQPGLSIVPVEPYFTGKLHIFDTYATWHATPATTVALELDRVINRNPSPAADAHVTGGTAYLQRRLTPRTAAAARAGYLFDDGGLFSGRTQRLKAVTLTYDFVPADGFLVRGEWRRDWSDVPFFLTHDVGVVSRSQQTATLGLVWWWGTKRGAW